jgi:translocation and assembly module TamB
MRRALKISAWAVGSVAGLALLLVAALFVAGNTQAGRSMIERVTLKLTGGYVKLSGLGGSFPAHLTLERLELIDRGGIWLTADRISVNWSPWALTERRIAVEEAQAARVDMERTPLGEPSSGGGPVWIPHIDVAQFSIGEVHLGAQLAGRPATLSVRGGGRLHALDDALADVVARRIDGDGEYTVHFKLDPKRMDGTLEVHEPASGPLENILSVPGLGALSANLKINGPRDAEQIELALDAGGLTARARGTVDLRNVSADLTYSLEAPAVSPRPDLSWQRVALEGRWRGAFTDPDAEGHLELEKLILPGGTQIAALHADLAAGSGIITLKGSIEGLRIPGPAPSLLEKDPLKIDAAWRVKEATRPLALRAAHRLFSLEAQVLTAGDQSATLNLKLPSVAPFAALAGQDVRGDAAIKAEIHRRGSGLALDLDLGAGISGGAAAWIGIVGNRLALKASGAFSDDSVSIDRLELSARALALSASGSATRPPAGAGASGATGAGAGAAGLVKDFKARWDLRLADLSIFGPELAGALQASGTLRGTPAALGADADLKSTLSIRGSPPGTVIGELHARGLPSAPSATIKLRGTMDDSPLELEAVLGRAARKGLKADIQRADWKSVHLSGTWQMESSLADSRGKLELKVGELGDFDHLLDSNMKGALEGSAVFTPQGKRTHAQFQLSGTDLVAGQFSGALHLTGEGDTESVAAELTVESPDLKGAAAKLVASAVVNLGADEVQIVSAAADYRGQQLKLLAPAKASYRKGFSIEELKLGMQDAVLQVEGELSPELNMSASLTHVEPKLMNAFLSDVVSVGTIEGQAHLKGSLAAPTGLISVHARGVRFSTDEAVGLPAIDLNAGAELAADSALLDVRLNAGNTPLLTATGSVPYRAGGSYDLKIGGKLDVGLVNPLFEARGMHVGGKLTVDATVGGDLAKPRIRGAITLAQGNIRDYVRGLNLTNINGEVDGSEGTLQIKSFKASAASGTFGMTGSIGILQPGIPVDIKVTAASAQPITSNILTANLNADIHISGKARERLSIAGSIRVNRAVIGIPDSLPPEVAVLDVRRRGKPVQAAVKQTVIALDVSINAPRQVLVQGRGLDAELGGSLQISGTTAAPQVSGGFQLQRGSFTIASSKLNFDSSSQIGFDGTGLRNKIDPWLDFTATNNSATLHITGYADAPKFDFTSTTGQSPDEIMSQLLFGVAPSQLSALQLAEVGAALATLSGVGGSGGNPLTKLQKSLGLDRLSVGAGTTTTATGATANSGAAIQAGRYITKRVYIEGKQSTAGQSQVEVDVDLTKHLKLQTRLGNGTAIQGTTPDTDPGSSVGLSYQFEY